jgi:hypothetical protein
MRRFPVICMLAAVFGLVVASADYADQPKKGGNNPPVQPKPAPPPPSSPKPPPPPPPAPPKPKPPVVVVRPAPAPAPVIVRINPPAPPSSGFGRGGLLPSITGSGLGGPPPMSPFAYVANTFGPASAVPYGLPNTWYQPSPWMMNPWMSPYNPWMPYSPYGPNSFYWMNPMMNPYAFPMGGPMGSPFGSPFASPFGPPVFGGPASPIGPPTGNGAF